MLTKKQQQFYDCRRPALKLLSDARDLEAERGAAGSARSAAEAAVRGARGANARLRGRAAEVAPADLATVAGARLDAWLAWAASRGGRTCAEDAAGVRTPAKGAWLECA